VINSRSYLKNVFWLPAFGGIGASFKILEILEYACYRSDCYAVGFKLGPAANLNRSASGGFEMASKKNQVGNNIVAMDVCVIPARLATYIKA